MVDRLALSGQHVRKRASQKADAVVLLEIQKEDYASALRDYALLTESPSGRKSAADLEDKINVISTMVENDSRVGPPFMVADLEIDIERERYRGARSSRYRVWCLQQLRQHWQTLPDQAQLQARELLERHGCWEPLWQLDKLPMTDGQEHELPFRAQHKMLPAHQ